jgi:excisionase family DNA binding protein
MYKSHGANITMTPPPNPRTPVLLTVKQVAQILQWNPYTVIKKAEKGELPGFKMGRGWRFREEDIVQWIERQRNGQKGHA